MYIVMVTEFLYSATGPHPSMEVIGAADKRLNGGLFLSLTSYRTVGKIK